MIVVCRLRDDTEFIKAIQQATTTTEQYGIEPTDGLFGCAEWWSRVDSGRLAGQTLRGRISRSYMAGHNDWPMFELTSDEGEKSHWTREANTKEQSSMYRVGRRVEIDCVVQHHRPASCEGGTETTVVLEIRAADAARQSAAADRPAPRN